MVPGYRFWVGPIALQCFVRISDQKNSCNTKVVFNHLTVTHIYIYIYTYIYIYYIYIIITPYIYIYTYIYIYYIYTHAFIHACLLVIHSLVIMQQQLHSSVIIFHHHSSSVIFTSSFPSSFVSCSSFRPQCHLVVTLFAKMPPHHQLCTHFTLRGGCFIFPG